MAGALLASRMEQKIKQELFNVSLSPPTFIGDSEIVLRMIAKNDPAANLVFYGVRLMEILAVSHSQEYILSLLHHEQSLSTVLLHKVCRT